MSQLGEAYIPKGKALETAQQVLQVTNPYAVNVAMGCSNKCTYCYGDTSNRQWVNEKGVRLPKASNSIMVYKQLQKGLKPEGFFLSFMTDPFIKETKNGTEELLEKVLLPFGAPIATLSKVGFYDSELIRTGMTIVSADDRFSAKFEPNALPVSERIRILKNLHMKGRYTWVSMEPFPAPKIWGETVQSLLERIDFVDFIVFGKWNYNKLADDADFYRKQVIAFQRYCNLRDIRHHVKTDTLKFVSR